MARRSEAVFVVWVDKWFVLEVHWVVCLVIEEPLSLEEVLAPLECALLLHLLETVLIMLEDLLGILIGLVWTWEVLLIGSVLVLQIGRAVMVAELGVRAGTASRRASVAEGDTINVVSHDGPTTRCLLAARAHGSCWHVDVHIAAMSDRRRAVSMDTVSLWRLVLTIKVHLFLELSDQSCNLYK